MIAPLVYLGVGFGLGVVFRSHNSVDTKSWENNLRAGVVAASKEAPQMFDTALNALKRGTTMTGSGGNEKSSR